ncbi:hypothetical protein ACYOEI_05420 [Singulisphaera rosea]
MGRPRLAKHPKPVEPEDESPEEPAGFETHGKATSKADAVRAALAEGIELPGDIAEFVLKKFGHDISKPMVSSYKAQEKMRQAKRAEAAPAPRREPARKPAPPTKATAPAASNGDLVDDIVAVKQLVAKLGGGQVRKLIDLFE